ncbi:MAG: MFS transporter [Nitrolancea sp.]
MSWRPRLRLSHDNRRIFYGMAFGEGAFGIYQTLWPLYIAELGATPPQVGVVMGVVGISRLFTLIPSGILADHIPPRAIMVVGRTLTALGMLLFAVANSWWQLILFGLVISAGAIAFPTILSTIAAGAGEGPDRTRVFTLINTVAPSTGLLITPALGGLIAATISLRAVFIVAGVFAAGAALSFSTITPKPPPSKAESSANYRTTLANRSIMSILLMEMVAIFALSVGIALVPNYLQDVHHVSDGVIGVFGSIGAAGSISLGLIIHRIRRFQQPFNALFLSIGSVAVALLLLSVSGSTVIFALAYLLRGGFFVTWTLFEAALSVVTPAHLRSRTYALAEIMSGAGFAIGPFMSGWLYAVKPAMPLYAGLALTIAILMCIPLAQRRFIRGTTAVMFRAANGDPVVDQVVGEDTGGADPRQE